MNIINTFKIGNIYTNKDIIDFFGVNRQGGIRPSKKRNALILTCNHLKKTYNDRWINDILYYSGMGVKKDSQKFERGNKVLNNSLDLDIKVFLFEIFKEREYTFSGEVYLYSQPQFETQYNKIEKCNREVIIFPLKLKNNSILEFKKKKNKSLKSKSVAELKILLKEKQKNDIKKEQTSFIYTRNPLIREIAIKKANGICQLCGSKAPFLDKYGNPYLESHHIIPLSKGGSDSIKNVAALCPNCHKKIHILEDEKDTLYLKNK